jgi:diadenosine tetraphosphate (Ap4A) HIT family hydrolase
VKEVTGIGDLNVLQNNGGRAHQVVKHVHFHLIPKPPDGGGLGIGWPSGDLDPEEGADLALRIADAIRAELPPD